jgi:hypothetical protein
MILADHHRKSLSNEIKGDFINLLVMVGIDFLMLEYGLIEWASEPGLVSAIQNGVKEYLP